MANQGTFRNIVRPIKKAANTDFAGDLDFTGRVTSFDFTSGQSLDFTTVSNTNHLIDGQFIQIYNNTVTDIIIGAALMEEGVAIDIEPDTMSVLMWTSNSKFFDVGGTAYIKNIEEDFVAHNHDGANSDKILATDLDPTGSSEGELLKIVGGTPTWSDLTEENLDWTVDQSATYVIHRDNLQDASTTEKGVVELATNLESTPGVVVQGNDSRLSDARTPLAHTHTKSEVTDFVEGDYVHTTGNETVAGDKVFTGTTKIGHTFTTSSQLSVQNNGAFSYIEILNDAGANEGAFFGMENNGPGNADQHFALYNWQGGPITFYTDPLPSAGSVPRVTIQNTGELRVHDLALGLVRSSAAGVLSNGTVATADIDANAITNTELADMAANTLKGNDTGGAGDPKDLTASEARALLNVEDGANNYSHPNHSGEVTSTGDGATLVDKTAITNKSAVVAEAGDYVLATDGSDSDNLKRINVSDFLDGGYIHPNHTGDVTSAGDGATTISANAVTNSKLADMPADTLKGNNTASPADPLDLTPSQVRNLINVADGAEVNVQSDWNSVAGDDLILNKPTDLTVLSSHSATELSDISDAGSGAVISNAERAALHDALTLGGVASDTTDDTLDLTGQVLTVNAVTTSTDGAMLAADKTKLDGIEASANNYSHPNHTGEVTSTGDGGQVVDKTAITNKTQITPEDADFLLISDDSDNNN